MQQPQITFRRKRQVLDQTQFSHYKLYQKIRDKLFFAPIKDGKASLWIQGEIDAWCAAVARGCSEDEIRSLVARLEADRKTCGQ